MTRAVTFAAAASTCWIAAALAYAGDAMVPPAQDYMLNCRGCHGADARGAPGHVPSLVGLDRFLATPQGRAYVVQVPGVAHVGISDARVAALLNWTLESFGNCRFEAYTEEEVAGLRRGPSVSDDSVAARLVRPVVANSSCSTAEAVGAPH